MTEERTALLIIRAWVEQHPIAPLRANIRWTMDIAGGFSRPVNLVDAEAVTQVVRTWLHDVEADGHEVRP